MSNPSKEKPECFIIMPISEVDSYPAQHFKRVYDDIIQPACSAAGYKAVRADDIKESNLIHLDILKRLLSSPMAICDLSSRNPNVLFELGLRQAFDKPVVLIQEQGTKQIFDIAGLRCIDYRKERIYHEVIEDQKKLESAITATATAPEGSVNSIVKLLSISTPARIPQISEEVKITETNQLILAELSKLRSELRTVQYPMRPITKDEFKDHYKQEMERRAYLTDEHKNLEKTLLNVQSEIDKTITNDPNEKPTKRAKELVAHALFIQKKLDSTERAICELEQKLGL